MMIKNDRYATQKQTTFKKVPLGWVCLQEWGGFAEALGESSCVFKQRQWGCGLEDSVQP